jgi:hypothetical protein
VLQKNLSRLRKGFLKKLEVDLPFLDTSFTPDTNYPPKFALTKYPPRPEEKTPEGEDNEDKEEEGKEKEEEGDEDLWPPEKTPKFSEEPPSKEEIDWLVSYVDKNTHPRRVLTELISVSKRSHNWDLMFKLLEGLPLSSCLLAFSSSLPLALPSASLSLPSDKVLLECPCTQIYHILFVSTGESCKERSLEWCTKRVCTQARESFYIFLSIIRFSVLVQVVIHDRVRVLRGRKFLFGKFAWHLFLVGYGDIFGNAPIFYSWDNFFPLTLHCRLTRPSNNLLTPGPTPKF